MSGRPKRRGTSVVVHGFRHGDYYYAVQRPLIVHPDYDLMLVALRSPTRGSGPSQAVVLKRLPAGGLPSSDRRILEEMRLARHLRHHNIASVLGVAYDEGVPYLIMEYIPGCFLTSALEAAVMLGRNLSPQAAAYVAAEVADALDYAHRCEDDNRKPLGIVHRAVSPVSIRLGRGGSVRLMNFGASWSELRGRLETPEDLLRGNPAYVAPEIVYGVIRGRGRGKGSLRRRGFDKCADIFSLGLVLLESLTACHPLDPPTRLWVDVQKRFPPHVRSEHGTFIPLEALANRLLHFGPEQVEQAAQHVPEALRHIIARALRVNPEERYQAAADMRHDLHAYLRGSESPFGSRELEAEVSALLKEATDHRVFAVSSGVERGLFPDSPVS